MFKSKISRAWYIGISCTMVGLYIGTSYHLRSVRVQRHPSIEFAKATLKLDKRVSNYCGKNYKITKYESVGMEEEEETIKYRLRVEGIRGKCKVLVKLQKSTHDELKRHSEEQQEYSKKTRTQRAMSTFIPHDYNDIIIPTKETLQKMVDMVANKNDNDKDKDSNNKLHSEVIKNYNRTNSTNLINTTATKQEPMKTLNTPIAPRDTFYRIASIIFVASDSLTFNVRPITAKNRTYDIEDTVYRMETYSDIFSKCASKLAEYDKELNSEVSTEDFRNEILQMKQTKYQDLVTTRKRIIIFNMIIAFMGLIAFRVYASNTLDVTALKALQSKVAGMNSKYLGNAKKLLCFSYRYNFRQRRFNIRGLCIGDKGQLAKLYGNSEANGAVSDIVVKPVQVSQGDGSNKVNLSYNVKV